MKNKPLLFRFLERVKDAFFPVRCPFCGQPLLREENCCSDCRPRLALVDPSRACSRCGKQSCVCGLVPVLEMTRSCFYYEGPAQEAVWRLKFRHRPGAALGLGGFMAEAVREDGRAWDLAVPIPMTAKKRRRRGYNQAELLCRSMAERLGMPAASALKKIRETKAQHTLDARERAHNLAGAYAADPKLVEGRRVLICDDVLTTGATLREAAAALLRAGALEVGAVTVCCVERGRAEEPAAENTGHPGENGR